MRKPEYLNEISNVWIERPSGDIRLNVNRTGITNVNITTMAKQIHKETGTDLPWEKLARSAQESMILAIIYDIQHVEDNTTLIQNVDMRRFISNYMNELSGGKWNTPSKPGINGTTFHVKFEDNFVESLSKETDKSTTPNRNAFNRKK